MKLQFKEQLFQLAAVQAIVDVFEGQPSRDLHFTFERYLKQDSEARMFDDSIHELIGYRNQPLQITEEQVIDNLKAVQRHNFIPESQQLERIKGDKGSINLTVEMETGTGKTYTYIRTMYELNRHYGWSKFIIVVPSIAIREGVYKSFELTEEHFMQLYGHKVRAFIYNSSRPQDIESFATDNRISVMIINTQAFAARGKDFLRIHQELDQFGTRKPIDILAQTNPILIIDEPQSTDGAKTLESMKDFKAIFSIRYSATHKIEYNKVFRLDALDAYNQKLVKKIQVKGITLRGITGTTGYIYLERIEIQSGQGPVAIIEFDKRTEKGIKRVREKFTDGDSLYVRSGELKVYQHCIVTHINAEQSKIETNGQVIYVGEGFADNTEERDFRRIQIRETIISHLNKERQLYNRGIKVLSLFFIDQVEKYRKYDGEGKEVPGEYVRMFEEEYNAVRNEFLDLFHQEYTEFLKTHNATSAHKGYEPKGYFDYLRRDDACRVHSGYFAIDKKGRSVDPTTKRGKEDSDDESAYELIMKDKERLLSFEEPTRFIFSHSALKEGWDNPNVFQICALKFTDSTTTRRRQEVGRGMRLCVNKDGIRQDYEILGDEVHQINQLSVIANESYESFAKGLQNEIADAIKNRPQKVTTAFFAGHTFRGSDGTEHRITQNEANDLIVELRVQGVIDKSGQLTENGRNVINSGLLSMPEGLERYASALVDTLNKSICGQFVIENERRKELVKPNKNFYRKEFQELWNRIKIKTIYKVNYDSEELISRSINLINDKLSVSHRQYEVKQGEMSSDVSAEAIQQNEGFEQTERHMKELKGSLNVGIRYDLIGEIERKTNLTRRTISAILQQISEGRFRLFTVNPEEFIMNVSQIINEVKSVLIVDHITYHRIDDEYDALKVFSNYTVQPSGPALLQHIFDYVQTDSAIEKDILKQLDTAKEVVVYAKLPKTFYVTTPIANYSPDWAIVFDANEVKNIYFVAESKGSEEEQDRRGIENTKIHCWKKHLEAISGQEVRFAVIKSYEKLLELVNE